ncbi:polar amino acid transport system substrate-binding protein [Maridesulfovibrio ferrireducens]|uniref:Polar amino acid transport system substrate-binding protein n=1 Tax=Maridesulfovibrio ferrireducens TaxID=246191 RepID=A0A1G9FPY2_9BACT|nr:transporter substrate-binding domain-containing protein [Maridesulfovibrio ferrireducens]SDK90402.1 polar amino acid transport system substrate-binding protein [Maridesulfovibrio ferrireducens]
MKIFLIAVTIGILFIPIPSIAKRQIFLATENFPPLYYQEDGKNKGIYCELLDRTFKEIKITYKLSLMPWKRALRMAETQKSDGIPGTAKNKHRNRVLIFPDEPLSELEVVIFHRKGEDFKYNGISSLKGKKIGIIKGYTYGEEFDQSNLFTKEEVSLLKLNFLKLKIKRLDLVIAYKVVALYTLEKMNLTDQFSYSPNPVRHAAMYLAFSQKPGNGRLAKKFSRALQKIKNTKEVKESFIKAGLNTEPHSTNQ